MSNLTTRAGKGSPLTNNELDANFTNLNADKVEIGGDLSGTSTAPNVAKIQGRAVSADAPEAGEKLVWNGSAWEPSVDPSGEPIGHADKEESTISFNSGTRTFTIAPVAASFTVWCKGVKHTYTSAQTVAIPNTTGLHFIYFDASGVLSTQMNYFTWDEHAPTAYIYWNASTQQAVYFGDERHGITLDWQTHEYLHRTRGAAISSGFGASGYTTTGLGATDADAQIDIGGGTFFDEDLQVTVVSTNTPVAGTWQQDLSGPARIPVLYLAGSSWVIDAPTNFPFKVVSGVPQYNLYSGGTWSTASVTNNSYFVSWILATNNLTYPVIAVISQAPTNQLSVAEAMTFEGLNLNGFPSVEFRPLYKVIYQYKSGFTNSIKASTIAVYDLRSLQSAGVAAALVQDHGNLSGLGDDDHAQYLHVSEVRSPSAAVKNSFLPSQSGNSGKYLTTDGSNPSWGDIPSGSLSFTGDVTGTGNTGSSTTLTLSNSGVTAGTFTKVTVDAKGRVTLGASLGSGDVTTALGFTPESSANKGVAGGYASLDVAGKVPSTQLPSYVDDVLEYANLAAFPATGETGKIYIAIDSAKTYRWSGSAYVEITASPGSTDAVPEGSTNLYFTNARARAAVDAAGSLSYNVATGIFSYTQPTNVSAFTNDSGYLTGITGTQVTTALGYTPPQPNGTGATGTWGISITGNAATVSSITSGQVTTALGYTPINPTLPISLSQSAPGTYGAYFSTSAYGVDQGDNRTHFGYNTGSAFVNYIRGAGTYFASGTVEVGGYQVLHAGNYSGYALPLSGGDMSGRIRMGTFPNSVNNTGEAWIGRASDRSTGTMTVQLGNSADRAFEVVDNAWSIVIFNAGMNTLSYKNSAILHASNYNFYSPTLTGTGASGTWGISISGNAATATNSSQLNGRSAHQLFNNMGQSHSTYQDFNNVPDFGAYYVQQGGNSPTGVASHQWYGFTLGLGNDYAYSSYASQLYWPRRAQNSDTYIYVRDRESGSWTSWNKIKAGYADTAGSADQIDGWGFANTGSNAGINADTLASNGITYYTSGVTNFSGNSTDGALYSQVYSGDWQHQIAGDYRSGQIALRGKNLGTWQSWRTVLDSGNYSSYALPLSGGTLTGALVSPTGQFRKSQTAGNYTTAALWTESYDNTATGIAFHISGNVGKFLEMRTNGILYWNGDTVIHSGNYTSYVAPAGGSWYGSNLPGSRWYGWSVGGGEIVMGQNLPNSGQMGMLVDGCYIAGEGNGFWSLPSDNNWNNRRGFYWDGSNLNFNTNNPQVAVTRLTVGGGGNSSWINMEDADEGVRYIHNNSGTIGFVANDGNWSFRVGDDGNVWFRNYGWLSNILPAKADSWYHSDRDFPSGTLIQTNINYAVTYGDPFILEIRGNSYGSMPPFDIQYQGYIYYDTIINHGGYSNGTNISGLVAINYNGNLCFWFPNQGYWQGYYVRVYVPYATYPNNRVTSISNSGKPTTAKEVALSANIRQSLHSGNYSSYALPLSGGTVTGGTTFNGNITVSASNATGGGIILADDGDIVDLNDAYCSMRFSSGVRIYSANRGGSPVITLGSNGVISAGNISTGVTGSHIVQRDGNGYIYANHINFSTSESENPTINSFFVSNGDGWSRKASKGHVINQLELPGNYVRGIGYPTSSNDWNSLGNTYENTVQQVDPSNFSSTSNGPTAASYTYGTLVNFSSRSSSQAQIYISHAGNDLIFRGGWNGTSWQTWNKVLTNQNYTSYSPSLTGSGASGTWGISISGSAAQLNGYSSAENGASIVLRTASNGYLYLYSWINTGGGGLFSSTNGAHWYPNDSTTYGTWRMSGSRNGYTGFSMDASNGQMAYMVNTNSNISGSYNHSYGWHFYWEGGTFYVGKNTYGGGQVAVLDGSNYSNYAIPLSANVTITPLGSGNTNPLYFYDQWKYIKTEGWWLVLGAHANEGVKFRSTSTGLDSFYINHGTSNYDAWFRGNVTAYSDERVKSNWEDLPSGFIDRLATIKSGTFNRLDYSGRQAGVSAQSMRGVLPEAVTEDEDGMLSVAYGNAAMVSAVELAKELVMLKKELAELKSRLH